MKKHLNSTRKAITKCGGVRKTADKLGVTTQSIYYWIRCDRIPINRALQMTQIFDNITRAEVRPDLFMEDENGEETV